jgi:hypothetical protein
LDKIDDGDFWKAKALATALDLAKERAERALADFQGHLQAVKEKYKIREGIDSLNDDGSIKRGPTEEAKQ